jgi:N6-adenosine-specific RNA methylase IME4
MQHTFDEAKGDGLVDEIVLFEGKILDGRARYAACIAALRAPRFREFSPDIEGHPADFVLRENLLRKHLKDPQLAMIAARLVTAQPGHNQYSKEGTTIVAASTLVGVHPKRVERARRVLEKSPIAADAVANLRISVGVAEKLAGLSFGKQEAILAGQTSRSALRKQIHRAVQEQKHANPAAIPKGRFDVLVSDPPWGVDKVPYKTMTVEEIDQYHRPIFEQNAADHCRLFLWTTQAFLPAALRLVGGWGWKYETTMVWHKNGGHQHPDRQMYNCEFVVVATKGSPEYVDTRRLPACFYAERREHSRKPDEFYETIRRVTAGPRLELFARRPHDGFEPHGDEIDWSTPTESRPATAMLNGVRDLREILLRPMRLPYFEGWLAETVAKVTDVPKTAVLT